MAGLHVDEDGVRALGGLRAAAQVRVWNPFSGGLVTVAGSNLTGLSADGAALQDALFMNPQVRAVLALCAAVPRGCAAA